MVIFISLRYMLAADVGASEHFQNQVMFFLNNTELTVLLRRFGVNLFLVLTLSVPELRLARARKLEKVLCR